MPAGRYARPPIAEAVIECRFASAVSQATLARFVRNIAREYPATEQTYEISAQLRVVAPDQEPEVRPEQKFSGFKLTGRDQADVVILGLDRIATIRLAPYCGWENFITIAKRNYEILRKVSGHRNLVRVATRYVNRLDIPIEDTSVLQTEDYLLVEPRIPPIIPSINSFSTRFVGTVPEIEGLVTVNAGTRPSPLIDHASLLLDIDLFKEQNLPRKEQEIWELLNTLRRHKNVIFEAFITDRARELFDHA
jgi:uncharacterized protein (TIGR04255 family)